MVDLDTLLHSLADDALALPVPLEDLQLRTVRRRRRRRVVRGAAAIGIAVVLAVPALAVLRHEGPRDVSVAAGPTPTTSQATSGTEPATTTTTEAPASADGRLTRPYTSASYQPDSGALGSFRVDPAPTAITPRMSAEQALAAVVATEAGWFPASSDRTTIVRFGLFTGNVSNPPAPDHTLTGSHPVAGEPAWVVVVEGVNVSPSGGGRAGSAISTNGPSDAGTTAPAISTTLTATPETPVKGYAVTVLSDATGELLTGLSITGGGSSGVR